jgi:hypothetical protein
MELSRDVIQQKYLTTHNSHKLQLVLQSIIPEVVVYAARELLDTNTNLPETPTRRFMDGLDWLTSCAVVVIWYSDNINILRALHEIVSR